MSERPLAGRIALVTGASRGIGRESALALAKAGAHVIAAARTQGGLEELDDEIFAATGEHATLVPLDLMNGDGIDHLGRAIFDRWGKLDILVHAAGFHGGLSPVPHIGPAQWDKVLGVNVTAAYRLIRSTEMLLRRSDRPRALFVTTGQGIRSRAFWGPYAASKAALDVLVRCWADEVETFGVRAALIDPGVMRTKMRAEVAPGEDPMSLPHPSEIGPLVVELASAPDLPAPAGTVLFREWKAAQPA
jgi:NAD(P)-dependent dehydrogenase (short-subunit alcohol dehydrogenase family)